MRSLALMAVTALACQAQALTEHAAAAAGATIGTAGGKQVSNGITKIFGQVDETAKKAAQGNTTAPKRSASATPAVAPSAGTTESVERVPVRRRTPRPVYEPTASVSAPVLSTRIAEEPPRKEPTVEQLAGIQVGTTEADLIAALGAPASRITIPDEGHLREICEYWAKGKPLGTVRLDNGQVVTVEPRTEN